MRPDDEVVVAVAVDVAGGQGESKQPEIHLAPQPALTGTRRATGVQIDDQRRIPAPEQHHHVAPRPPEPFTQPAEQAGDRQIVIPVAIEIPECDRLAQVVLLVVAQDSRHQAKRQRRGAQEVRFLRQQRQRRGRGRGRRFGRERQGRRRVAVAALEQNRLARGQRRPRRRHAGQPGEQVELAVALEIERAAQCAAEPAPGRNNRRLKNPRRPALQDVIDIHAAGARDAAARLARRAHQQVAAPRDRGQRLAKPPAGFRIGRRQRAPRRLARRAAPPARIEQVDPPRAGGQRSAPFPRRADGHVGMAVQREIAHRRHRRAEIPAERRAGRFIQSRQTVQPARIQVGASPLRPAAAAPRERRPAQRIAAAVSRDVGRPRHRVTELIENVETELRRDEPPDPLAARPRKQMHDPAVKARIRSGSPLPRRTDQDLRLPVLVGVGDAANRMTEPAAIAGVAALRHELPDQDPRRAREKVDAAGLAARRDPLAGRADDDLPAAVAVQIGRAGHREPESARPRLRPRRQIIQQRSVRPGIDVNHPRAVRQRPGPFHRRADCNVGRPVPVDVGNAGHRRAEIPAAARKLRPQAQRLGRVGRTRRRAPAHKQQKELNPAVRNRNTAPETRGPTDWHKPGQLLTRRLGVVRDNGAAINWQEGYDFRTRKSISFSM
ncbi:MAG: hypothetical protein BWZ08_01889 [candidate division BRC1 bacterium ADurb.BinA292]|nr:MAG: hypothetical protein BWZ08_01889 [candidate division BRC1 bacterium ADurb.BinA292]